MPAEQPAPRHPAAPPLPGATIRPGRSIAALLLAAAAVAIAPSGLSATRRQAHPEDPPADPRLEGIAVRRDEGARLTLYEPARRPWEPWEFRVDPVLGLDDDGGRLLRLRAATKGRPPPGLTAIEVVADGRSIRFDLPPERIRTDASGCRGVAETAEIDGDGELFGRIAGASEVLVRFHGSSGVRSHRLTEEARAAFRRIAALHGLAAPPRPEPSGAAGRPGGGTYVPPVLLGRPRPPRLPQLARREKRAGLVVVDAVIGADGSVTGAEVLSSTIHDCGFEEAALEAVRTWRYRPATFNGRPVEVHLPIDIDFRYLR